MLPWLKHIHVHFFHKRWQVAAGFHSGCGDEGVGQRKPSGSRQADGEDGCVLGNAKTRQRPSVAQQSSCAVGTRLLVGIRGDFTQGALFPACQGVFLTVLACF